MTTLIWRANALADLEQVMDYISARDALAAERLLAIAAGGVYCCAKDGEE